MFVFLTTAHTQNLVPNWSFEDVNTCPTVPSNIYETDFWFSNYPSPDFYHECGDPYMDVPSNSAGYQEASTGSAYTGAYAWPQNEFIQVELTDFLIAGHVYEGSFTVNLIDNAQYALDNIGMYLSATDNTATNASNELLVTPQIVSGSGGPITSTVSWETISGTFIADGTERFLTIGRFGLISAANLTEAYPAALWGLSYYVYDDVILTDLTILPVELVDFKVVANHDQVELFWDTMSEINSDSFVIQRSYDGYVFTDIGNVTAQGNSFNPVAYHFTDYNVNSGQVYYRLKQVDINGDHQIYGPVAVTIGTPIQLSIIPNPCTDACILKGNFWDKGHTIQIVTNTGQVLWSNPFMAEGVTFHSENYRDGMYVVRLLKNGGVIAAEKFLIVK